MTEPVELLLKLFDLAPVGVNRFVGISPSDSRKRVFGGQVVAQALIAACNTVADREPHSLHAYFLLPGDPAKPIVYEVERLRDGRSFTTRRVVARQDESAIFATSVSFHIPEDGYEHQMAAPAVPGPQDLLTIGFEDPAAASLIPPPIRAYFQRARPIEMRPVNPERYAGPPTQPRFAVWFRTAGPLPDTPLMHQAALAYASDMTLLDTSLAAHGKSVLQPEIMAASLDHALWFHRPFRADDWLLYSQDSPTATGGRGFSRGLIHDQAGRLVASVSQEGLIRPRRA